MEFVPVPTWPQRRPFRSPIDTEGRVTTYRDRCGHWQVYMGAFLMDVLRILLSLFCRVWSPQVVKALKIAL